MKTSNFYLRQDYKSQTGESHTKSQGEPDIDYVFWLEDELIKQLNIARVTNSNWFQRLPLHWRFAYYLIGGIGIGLLLPYCW